MREIRVTKSELVEKITANRAAHRAIFEEAVEGYRKMGVELLEAHIKEILAGKIPQINVRLVAPEDHTSDYDRVLAMLEMSLDDEILIDEERFASYVLDDWHWKRQFLTTNSSYSAMARESLA